MLQQRLRGMLFSSHHHLIPFDCGKYAPWTFRQWQCLPCRNRYTCHSHHIIVVMMVVVFVCCCCCLDTEMMHLDYSPQNIVLVVDADVDVRVTLHLLSLLLGLDVYFAVSRQSVYIKNWLKKWQQQQQQFWTLHQPPPPPPPPPLPHYHHT